MGIASLNPSYESGRRSDWLGTATRAKFNVMETSSTSGLTKQVLSELERKFFWWEPVGSQPRSGARILAQAMCMAGFEEVRQLEQMLGHDRLAETMLLAEPGWFDER
jgi:hypothetical protein